MGEAQRLQPLGLGGVADISFPRIGRDQEALCAAVGIPCSARASAVIGMA